MTQLCAALQGPYDHDSDILQDEGKYCEVLEGQSSWEGTEWSEALSRGSVEEGSMLVCIRRTLRGVEIGERNED